MQAQQRKLEVKSRLQNMVMRCFVCEKVIHQETVRIVTGMQTFQPHPQLGPKHLMAPMVGVPVCDPCFTAEGFDDSEPSDIVITGGPNANPIR